MTLTNQNAHQASAWVTRELDAGEGGERGSFTSAAALERYACREKSMFVRDVHIQFKRKAYVNDEGENA